MNKRTCFALALALPLASTAVAQDVEEGSGEATDLRGHYSSGVAAPEEPEFTPSVTFSGFVDTSIFVPLAGYAADGDEVVLGLDQVEVDVTAVPTDGLTIQSDLQFFPAVPFDTSEDSLVNVADTIVEQGYIDYEGGSGMFLRAGKANAPIGAESIDAPNLYQYSWGQLFTSATPSNLTGFFGGYRGDSFSAQVWVTNDWDTPSTARSATPGLRLQYDFEIGHVGVASTFGPVTSEDPYMMVDADTGLSIGDLTLLGEVNFGTSDAVERMGFLLTANYAFTDWVSATLRGDFLATTETDATTGAELESKNTSLTAAALFTLADNFGSVVELRTDLPDEGDSTTYAAVEFLAWW